MYLLNQKTSYAQIFVILLCQIVFIRNAVSTLQNNDTPLQYLYLYTHEIFEGFKWKEQLCNAVIEILLFDGK